MSFEAEEDRSPEYDCTTDEERENSSNHIPSTSAAVSNSTPTVASTPRPAIQEMSNITIVSSMTDSEAPKSSSSEVFSRSRKRKRDESSWKKNIWQRWRQHGQEYTSRDGKRCQSRCLQQVDCSNHKYKCQHKISESERQVILDSFWGLGWKAQHHYFASTTISQKASSRQRKEYKGKRKSAIVSNQRQRNWCVPELLHQDSPHQ